MVKGRCPWEKAEIGSDDNNEEDSSDVRQVVREDVRDGVGVIVQRLELGIGG